MRTPELTTERSEKGKGFAKKKKQRGRRDVISHKKGAASIRSGRGKREGEVPVSSGDLSLYTQNMGNEKNHRHAWSTCTCRPTQNITIRVNAKTEQPVLVLEIKKPS